MRVFSVEMLVKEEGAATVQAALARLKKETQAVANDMKVAGEIYGRGPVITALPDIKTLNKVKELVLKNASLAIAGVYTAADDGVLNPNTIRQKLVDAIVELTGSELDLFTHKDFIDLAKESDSQLIDRLIHISHWYKNEYDNE